MRNLGYLVIFLSGSILAQSIHLNNDEPVKTSTPKKTVRHDLSYVEFRDAKLSNISMLIDTQSGLNGFKLSEKNLTETELSLRLENVSWAQLLKIIRNRSTP